MGSSRLALLGLALVGCATVAPSVQCLPPSIPPRAEWRPLAILAIPKCEDCQQVWAQVGDRTLVHAVILRGLVGVVSATVGDRPGPTWADPGVVVPGIPKVRPQPDPRQSCPWLHSLPR